MVSGSTLYAARSFVTSATFTGQTTGAATVAGIGQDRVILAIDTMSGDLDPTFSDGAQTLNDDA